MRSDSRRKFKFYTTLLLKTWCKKQKLAVITVKIITLIFRRWDGISAILGTLLWGALTISHSQFITDVIPR